MPHSAVLTSTVRGMSGISRLVKSFADELFISTSNLSICDAACLADTACDMSQARLSTCPERQPMCVTGSSWCRTISPSGQPKERRLAAGNLSGMRMHSFTRLRHAPQNICQFLLQKEALIIEHIDSAGHACSIKHP